MAAVAKVEILGSTEIVGVYQLVRHRKLHLAIVLQLIVAHDDAVVGGEAAPHLLATRSYLRGINRKAGSVYGKPLRRSTDF